MWEVTRADGYYVDRRLAYDDMSITFFNEKRQIRKKIVDRMTLVDFPGYEDGQWVKYVERMPITAGSAKRIEVYPFNSDGNTEILIVIQWHDTNDETGFGRECIPEISLYSLLDDCGNYLHPFKLNRLSY